MTAGFLCLVKQCGILAALLTFGAVGCRTGSAPQRPNVLLISIDTLRADHLSCSGYFRPTSPHIDRLAKEGTRFTHAYAASSWTVPSHMTLFTALPPSLHRVQIEGDRLDKARITLAERFHEGGYQTAAFVTGPTLHAAWGFDQGFDVYHNTMAFAEGDFRDNDATRPSDEVRRRSQQIVTGPIVGGLVTQWLEQEARPAFFLFVHLWDPHNDYIPPPPYDRFDPGYTGTFDFSNLEYNDAINSGMPASAFRHLVALYDGEVALADAVVGDIIGAFAQRGWLDTTLVVITSDHGEEFLEHGGRGHRRTLFNEVLHVPLIFRLPGSVAAAHSVDGVFGAVDLMPTILAVVGLDPGPEARGRDLSALLRGDQVTDDLWAAAELVSRKRPALFALRNAKRKYVAAGDMDTLQVSYYDLENDPDEGHALPAPPDVVEDVRQRLLALRTKADSLRREGPGAAALDEKTAWQLRALGYGEAEPQPAPQPPAGSNMVLPVEPESTGPAGEAKGSRGGDAQPSASAGVYTSAVYESEAAMLRGVAAPKQTCMWKGKPKRHGKVICRANAKLKCGSRGWYRIGTC